MRNILSAFVRDSNSVITGILFVTAIIVFASNQILAMRLREARKDVIRLTRSYTEPTSGAILPPIVGRSLQGQPISVGYGDGETGTIVLIASASCAFAKSNWDSWVSLEKAAKFAGYRSVYVDLTRNARRDFFTPRGVSATEVVRVDAESTLAYKFGVTPQTLLVGRDGKLLGAWTGVLSKEELLEITRVVGRTGPGDRHRRLCPGIRR